MMTMELAHLAAPWCSIRRFAGSLDLTTKQSQMCDKVQRPRNCSLAVICALHSITSKIKEQQGTEVTMMCHWPLGDVLRG